MDQPRYRIPIDEAYIASLGRAAYVFAVMEWNAVWCCEVLDDGYVIELGRKTAGMIGDDLAQLAAKHPDGDTRRDLGEAARIFRLMVQVRNSLFHGKPGTADDGTQSLFQQGRAWTIDRIDAAADDFARCCGLLNHMFYERLGGPR